MVILVIIIFVAFFIISPVFRCICFHPFKTIKYACRDSYTYIKHKKYNACPIGFLDSYTGLFGRGKTLSVVHRVRLLFAKCNNKKVWCPRRKKLVIQRIKVISNVALTIPYEEFVTLEQVVYASKNNQAYDDEHDTLTVTIVLGDEFSSQMNSRNFKTNINPLFLNTLLTCRHYYLCLVYTTQRQQHVDALLRQVTSSVTDCKKEWRFQRQNVYDAWEMENATNPDLLKPLRRSCWFVTDDDYEAYDTLACVGNLRKSFEDGDMMTEEEILALQQNQNVNMDGVLNQSRKYKRLRKVKQ